VKQRLFKHIRREDFRRQASGILGLASVIVLILYGRTKMVTAHAPVRLVVYAFSTQEEVFTQGIFPSFEQAWEAQTGRDLAIEGVFGPSETLAGQISLGAPADVALFSNLQQMNWLKVSRRLDRDTRPEVVGCTAMIIVTRPDNPTGITGFADLAQPGLRLLHPDPRSSGAGQWAVLAEYGNSWQGSGNQLAAKAQLEAVWRNVQLLGPSARSMMSLFELGAGDALVTYEQDAHLARERGVALEIVVPSRTIVAQHVAVVVDDNVTSDERPAAQAFVQYLLSDAGQQILGRYHLRPGDCRSQLFPELVQPFTVEDLGGWSRAHNELVEALWQAEIEPRLDLESVLRLLGPGE
jgi:ABC-type sulfate transport system substrate-binding protein